ncbi:TetR/AcrR family transcriptional regulator [Nocardia cyriacigeorgica]|uniref:TetR/AcrR family transcriptional regulator n=1 Tax=Nocardia cyriacigeorgica TaxID=135487 RepID=UPI001892EC41|nr:TetR/AcrR family transcriptional regulator [Nocardia cyriacigeorgica]MBF6399220.1 TetR/AcrR family transcriptional regulator [Nocardia cyriacigeorgica]MBF6404851.1 TetR/AcrR family transcriptional regulator [Nocardia cyriacigeorgica]
MTRPGPSGPKLSSRKYSGVAPEERVRLRRAAILESALEQYGTTGYSAASIKQICRGAGVTERYFYESFPNQEFCLAALYDNLAEAMRTETIAALEQAEPDLDALTAAGLDAFIRYLTGDPRRARVVLIEVVGVSPDMEQRRHRVLRDFVDTVMATWTTESPRALTRGQRLTATALVGGVNHLLVDWLMDGCRDDPADLVTVCVDLFAAARAQWDAAAVSSRRPTA